MENFNDLQANVYNRISQERAERELGAVAFVEQRQARQKEAIDGQVEYLADQLPRMRTAVDLGELERQGYEVRSGFSKVLSPKSLKPKNDLLGFANQALLRLARKHCNTVDAHVCTNIPEVMGRFEQTCIRSSQLILDLLLQPPPGIEICPRYPKLEIPTLATLCLEKSLASTPVPFVVPCSPDMTNYRLGSGISKRVPKSIEYCERVRETFDKHEFSTTFNIQIADVEGLDPVYLGNTGETRETHFVKTAESIQKTQAELATRGLTGQISASSMLYAFDEQDSDYLVGQQLATRQIQTSSEPKVQKIINDLRTERVKTGHLKVLETSRHRDTVIAELAGYAAYGALIGGKAIILATNAMSAVPAYNFLAASQDATPVFYAK